VTKNPTPRRHHHLSREAIAQAAVDLIDREGLEALSLRRLAATLHVRATNLYTYVPDKESLVQDVVALLLSEVDLRDRPGVAWEECVVSVGMSLRDMALRHPRAFPLVAVARYDEWPMIRHGERVERLFMSAGMPEGLNQQLSSMLDAYATGYLLLATQTLTGPGADSDGLAGERESAPRATGVTNTAQEYEQGTRLIVAAVKEWGSAPPSCGSDQSQLTADTPGEGSRDGQTPRTAGGASLAPEHDPCDARSELHAGRA